MAADDGEQPASEQIALIMRAEMAATPQLRVDEELGKLRAIVAMGGNVIFMLPSCDSFISDRPYKTKRAA